jgi:hypothetical protein
LRESQSALEEAVSEKKGLETMNANLEKENRQFEEELLTSGAVTIELEKSRKTAAADTALYREKWSSLASQHEEIKQQLVDLEASVEEQQQVESRMAAKEAKADQLAVEVTRLEGLVEKQSTDASVRAPAKERFPVWKVRRTPSVHSQADSEV